MPDPTPKPPVAGVKKRQARNRRREGSATPAALSDRERFERARATRNELAAEIAKLELSTARGELIAVADIGSKLRSIGEELKSALFARDEELAVLNAGLPAEEQLKNNSAATLALLSRWREFARKNGAE